MRAALVRFLQKHPSTSRAPIKRPFVTGAIIDPGNCLDLSDEGSLHLVKQAHANIQLFFDIIGKALPKNKPGYSGDNDLVKRELDCYVINYLHRDREGRKQPPFDTIRCPFMERGELFTGSKFHAKTHLQWCVRDPQKHIWGYFRPKILD